MPIPWSLWIYAKFHFSTLFGYCDTLVETEEEKEQQQGEDEEL